MSIVQVIRSGQTSRFPAEFRWLLFAVGLVLAIAPAPRVLGAPAVPGPHRFRQPDGTELRFRLIGDEYFNWYETEDGHPVVYDEASGIWTYAKQVNGGVGGSNGRQVGKHKPLEKPWRPVATAAEMDARKHREYRASVPTRSLAQASAPADGMGGSLSGGAPGTSNPPVASAGNPCIAMLLTKFSDTDTSQSLKTVADFESLFFDVSGPYQVSMANLYKQMSYGLHVPTSGPAHIQDWLAAPKKHDYYGGGSTAFGTMREDGTRVAELVRWRAVQADGTMDFGPYDTNNDGYVDLVCVVFQGTDQASGGSVNDIWPIRWDLNGSGAGEYETQDVNANGVRVKVRDFIVVPELSLPDDTDPRPITTIGLLCHEYGHGIGWPDLYDPPSGFPPDPDSEGLGNWCLMARGNWNKSPTGRGGSLPCWANPFLRMQSGWLSPVVPNGNLLDYRLHDAKDQNHVLLLSKNGAVGTEYHLVENRGLGLFDGGLPAGGLLIWHVDETVWSNNNEEWWYISPSDERTFWGHYKIALEQADGRFDMEKKRAADSSDPFKPGNLFADNTVPNSRKYNNEVTNVAVRNIRQDFGDMIADIYVRADDVFPTVAVTSPAANTNYDYVPSIIGTAWDNVGVAQVRVSLTRNQNDGTVWYNWLTNDWDSGGLVDAFHLTTANGTTSWFVNVVAGRMTPGNYTVAVDVKDVSNSWSKAITSSFTVVEDLDGPDIAFSSPANQSNLPASSLGSFTGTVINYTGGSTKQFVLEKLSETGGSGRLFFNWTNNTFSAPDSFGSVNTLNQVDSANTWSVLLQGRGLGSGRYIFWAKLYTDDLRESSWQQRGFRVDYPPLVTILTPAHQSALQVLSTFSGTFRDPGGTGLANGGVRLTLTDNGGQWWNGTGWSSAPASFVAPVSGSTWHFDNVPSGAQLADGVHQLSASLTTHGGETTTPVAGGNQITFTIDRSPPALAITSPVAGSTISGSTGPSFAGTVSDLSGVAWVNTYLRRESDQAYWTGSAWTFDPENAASQPVVGPGGQPAPSVSALNTTFSGSLGTWSCTSSLPRPGIEMQSGNYTFIVLAGDSGGNYRQVDSPVVASHHAVFVWTPSFGNGWEISNNWRSSSGGYVPRAAEEGDIASVSSGTSVLPGDRNLWGLWHMGGTITGAGALTAGDGYLSQGMLTGGTTLILTGISQKEGGYQYNIEGATLRNDGIMTQRADGSLNLDPTSGGGAGTVLNRGSWWIAGASTISDSFDGGQIINEGLFDSQSGGTTIHAAFHHKNNSIFMVSGGYVLLNGGGSMESGARIDTVGGSLYFNGGTHALSGGSFTGSSFAYCNAGTVQLGGDVGTSSGAATGGFGMSGGILSGTGTLSVDHGYFATGSITGSAVIRMTGNVTKTSSTTLNMNGGTIRNEGTLTAASAGNINLDSEPGGGAGTIINTGIWRCSDAFTYSNGHGGGVFLNEGLFESLAGVSMIAGSFNSETGSTFRSKSGYVRLGGGGVHQPGTTFDAEGGDIYFSAGTHQLLGGTFTGSTYVYATGATVSVEGNVGASTGAATGGFGIAAGTITGNATLSAERGLLQTGTIGGTVTIRLTGQSTKVANSTLDMNGGTIRNEGTVTAAAAGNINLDSATGGGAGTIVNTGTWRTNDAFTYSNGSGGGVFRNEGLFESLAGVSMIAGSFHSEAGSTFRSKFGYVRLGGGGIHQPGTTFDADGGDIYFSAGTHQLLGGTFTGSTYVYATGATVSVEGNVGANTGAATGGFGIAAGTITGNAMLSAERGLLQTGTIGGMVTIRLTGQSTKVATSTLDMNGGTVRNEGTMSQPAGGNFNLDSSSSAGAGTLVNIGTWNQTGGSSFTNGSNAGMINNYGLWHISAGNSDNYAYFTHHPDSIFRVSGGQMIFVGGGTMKAGSTIDANGGAVYLNGGTQTLEGGTITGASTVYCGAGTSVVTGDVGATSGAATGGFGIYNTGTVTGSAVISVDHGYLAAGNLGGTVTLRFTGTSQKITNTVLNMSGGMIRNEGIMNQAASGDFNLDSSASAGAGTIANIGTWNQTGGSNFTNGSNGGAIDNYGLWHISAGNSDNYAYFTHHPDSIFRVSGGQMIFVGGGTMKAGSTIDANGGAVYLNGGTQTLEGGAITGAGTVYCGAGTSVVTGDVGATSGTATGGFGIYNTGTVTGSAMISVDHGHLAAGNLGGTVTLRFTGTSQKITNTVLNMSGGTIRNEGIMNQAASGDFNLDSSASAGAGTIANIGTWNQTGGSNFTNGSNGGAIDNYGLWHISAGNSDNYAYFTHHPDSIFRVSGGQMIFVGGGTMKAGSTIDANGGAVYLNGGTQTLEGGAITGASTVYCGAGTSVVTGDVGATSGAATGGFGIYNTGTVTGSAMISVDHGHLAAGNLGGTVTLRFTGTSQKITNTVLNMSGGTIRNEGIMTVAASSDFNLDSSSGGGAGMIINTGTWTNTGNCNFTNDNLSGTLQNSGTFEVMAGTTNVYGHFTNSGLTRVLAGTLALRSGSTHTGGLVSNGGVSFVGGGHSLSGPGAFLGGTGSFSGAVSLTNAARIAPGNSSGTLGINGAVQFLTSTEAPAIAIEIDSATLFDRINLGNGATLSLGTGVTDLSLSLNYQPLPGETFRIVSAGTGTGAFSGRFRNAPVDDAVLSASYGGRNHYFQIRYESSAKYVELVSISAFQAWSIARGLAGQNAAFGADPDGDGLVNGLEFLFGGEPNPANPGARATGLQPSVSLDATYLRFVFRRSHEAAYLTPAVQFGADLANWTDAVDGFGGVTIEQSANGFAPGIDRVEVRIPRALGTAGRLFARLRVSE